MFSMRLIDVKKKLAGMKKRWYLNDKRTTGKSDPGFGKTIILNCKTILFSDQDCADAIQETIVKAFSKIDTLKNDKYARTWLIRILINECYNLVRKSSKFISFEDLEDRKVKGLQRIVCRCKFLKRGAAFARYFVLHRRFQRKRNRPDP